MTAQRRLKHTGSLRVTMNGHPVGQLDHVERKGIYFVYDDTWLASGFNLSPFTMAFNNKPQLARDNLFRGLHGPFADSLPDGWGLLLMDRFFNSYFGEGTSLTLTQLDRLAYLGDRGMGALEYRPATEKKTDPGIVDLASLFAASEAIQAGKTKQVLNELRIAGGSPGGARPKAIVALSRDASQAISAFDTLPPDYEHWIVKFRALDEPWETGAIEQAYAIMARNAGIGMSETRLLDVQLPGAHQVERFFATKRFDRDGDVKQHMITVCALVYASFREPTMDYSDLLKLTNMLTRSAQEVEKMARLMVFNALAHNYDDHTKNFAFLHNPARKEGEEYAWTLAPAYDLTFSEGMGEHITAFAGKGKPTRKLIRQLCKDYRYLKPDEYIEQTLDALSNWRRVFCDLNINTSAGEGLFRVLEQAWREFDKEA